MTSEAAGSPAAPRGRWRRLLRILGVVVTGIVVTLALLIAFPPAGLLKNHIARAIGSAIGRTVTIGDAHLAFRPDVRLRLDKLTVSNPPGMPGPDLLAADTLEATVDVRSLLRGQMDVTSLNLVRPEIRLQEDGQGVRNWVFPSKGEGKPSTALPRAATFQKGAVTYTSARSGATASAEDIAGSMTSEPNGTVKSRGSLGLRGDRVTYDLTLANIQTAADGKATDIKAAFEGRYAKVALAGQALIASTSTGTSAVAGDLTATTGSAVDLARWLGANVTPSGDPLRSSMSGKVKITTTDVIFSSTDIAVNTTSGRLDGRLAFSGPRPKFEGAVTTERIDVERITGTARRLGIAPEPAAAATPGEGEVEIQPAWQLLLADLASLEQGVDAGAAAQAQARSTRAPPAWSDEPISLAALKAVDLDMTIDAAEIAYGALDLKKGRVKATVNDGRIEAVLESLDVGQGKARGTLNIDTRAQPPQASVAIAMTDVAAEPIITEITGKPLLSGTSNVEITAKASGQNQNQLASTLEGKAQFNMGSGVLRGYDIRRMISEWWRGWSFDLARKTAFQKLEASYDIKNGIMKSSPGLSLGGSEVEISSKGNVNVRAKKLNQEIRVKIVPPPTALPIPVRISGDWTKPQGGIDWGSLFSGLTSASGLGGPQGIAPAAEPPPAEVQAAIRRVLDSDIPADRLSEEGKAMLRSLLPPAGASPP